MNQTLFILEVLTFNDLKEPADFTQDNGLIIEHRRSEHQFERQTEIDYIHPTNDGHTKKWTYF